MSEYFLQIGGEERGPFSLFQLESQPISESTPIRLEGTDDWRRAGDFPELQRLFRGGSGDQYGDFRDLAAEPSPYASPQAELHVTDDSGSAAPRWLGMISCGLGILSWLLLLGFFGYVVFMVIQEEQGGGEPPEAVLFAIGLSICFNFVIMLAGLLLGGIGVLLPESGKGWAIVGVIANGLPLLILGGLILLGLLLG
ncbi:DUF4339 domain-containing protein [Blastopirellula marina]|uniref:GYF domain-containing protein n=1 Tax=Blastopirellula marina DSM 3645 TaxID=314230 RepID=A3ZYF0_9BACT|nr:DUF4339 domain-containing protein [Blastopirellula marina]EAQ78398.1 hypothetical protein DSM3645_06896 [Blastopirellula marina DSM 3645]